MVPFTRGPERSRTADSVLAEAAVLASTGYSEIQLLGQNVNSYRDPSPKGWDFATLLDQVGRVPGIRRVRFTTSHPRDFGKSIIDAIDGNMALCNHVHLPVQSGSTRVLDAMQRLYTRDEYMQRIHWMKTAQRSIAITSDIIVGFPGETQEDYELTLDLLSTVEYDSIFAFKYSRRPNTSALAFDDQIPEEEKSRRLAIVQEHQRQIQIRRNAAYVDRFEECMVEGFNKATGQWMGRTSQHKMVNFLRASEGDITGQYVQVRVTRSGPNSLAGEFVNQDRRVYGN